MKIKFVPDTPKNLSEYEGLKIWKQPDSLHLYSIGVDVSEGVCSDASCAQVISCNTGEHVASLWYNTIDPDSFAKEVFKLGHFYNKAHLCIECNSVGSAIISLLAGSVGGLYYPHLYRRLTFDEYTQKKTKVIGFRTSRDTKDRLIMNLKSNLRDGIITTPDRQTILELNCFVRDMKGRFGAKGSAKDDRVMALALAVEQYTQLKENILPTYNTQYSTTQNYDPDTGFPIYDR